MYYVSSYYSPIGKLLIASDDKSLVGLWIEGQKYYMSILKEEKYEEKETKAIKMTKQWLDRYFNGEKPCIEDIPLKLIGSDFRKQVWKILLEIPYGETITYGNIAKEIAKRNHIKSMSAQAVGGAVGHNTISIIVPCHRVIGNNDNLTGYAGGIDKKIKLLKLEGIDTSNLK